MLVGADQVHAVSRIKLLTTDEQLGRPTLHNGLTQKTGRTSLSREAAKLQSSHVGLVFYALKACLDPAMSLNGC